MRLDVSDRLLDLTNGEADIGLRCGLGTWKGVTATKLMDEKVTAVASPLITPPRREKRRKMVCQANTD